METPLSPLEFMHRARRLYHDREAVVDGGRRWTYGEFFARVDRWSSALQTLGVKPGDRVAYIAPNTHAQLESFYAVPQIGAVLVPLNYRLSAEEFQYLLDHSGATVVCAAPEYLDAVDGIRAALGGVRHFVALEHPRAGLAGLRIPGRGCGARLSAAGYRRTGSHHHQLHERHDVAAQGRGHHAPECLGELGRRPRALVVDACGCLPVDAPDVPRQRVDVHVDDHRGRRAPYLPSRRRSGRGLSAHGRRARDTPVRGADRAHRPGERAGRAQEAGAARGAGDDRGRTAGGRHDPAPRSRARLDRHAGLRPHRNGAVHHHLRAAARAREPVGRRARPHQGPAGRGAHHVRRDPCRRQRRRSRCHATARPSARSSRGATS